MKKRLSDRRVFVFFTDRDTDFSESSFFCRLCKSYASAKGSAVIVVSPFFFSSVGLGEKKSYLTVREESANLYIYRKPSFFSLKRRVLSELDTVYFF